MAIEQLYKNGKKVKKFEYKLSIISESSKIKIMIFLYYINLISFIGLIILSMIDPFFGVLLLIPFAFLQVISSLILKTDNSISLKSQKLVSIYFYSIFFWVALMILTSFFNLEFAYNIITFLPILIAVYFMIITYLIYKENCNER